MRLLHRVRSMERTARELPYAPKPGSWDAFYETVRGPDRIELMEVQDLLEDPATADAPETRRRLEALNERFRRFAAEARP